MTFTYICDVCGTHYNSATEYSYLKEKLCCDFPVWYSRRDRDRLRKERPDQLKYDYVYYMQDVAKYFETRQV